MKWVILLAVMFGCRLLSGAAGADMMKGNERADPGWYSDPARPIEVPSGQEFTLTLESNPTTGFQWQIAKPLDETIVKLVGSEYQLLETRVVGAGGRELWRFQAVGRGKTEIFLQYVRPWEKRVKPAKIAIFSVFVN